MMRRAVTKPRFRRFFAPALRRIAGERGQAATEYALVLPLFLALVFGIMDFGWMGYQMASFNYAYTHAGWSVVAADMVDYDYTATRTGRISSAVAAEAVADEIGARALPGYDPACLTVTVTDAALTNITSTYGVPDRWGNRAEGTGVTRTLTVDAQVSYTARPLVGFSFMAVTSTRHLSFSRVVGVERRG